LLLHQKPHALVVVITIWAILGATLLVPRAAAITVNITVANSKGGGSGNFNFLTTFPVTVGFSVTFKPAGATYFWQFGDGTNSTDPVPTHIFNTPCVYAVQVRVRASNGSVTSGGVVIAAFTTKASSGGALAVCPPQGTAGLTHAELAGGYFDPNSDVNVTMNGASIGVVTADRGGAWLINLSAIFTSTPEPNGTQYTFTTSPASQTGVFTTLEGVSASPASGAPGDSVLVRGNSYPPNTSVQVNLGGLSLGVAQTDGSGSFLTTFQVPDASPLTSAGLYPYTTTPAILGRQASFSSTGSVTVISTSSSSPPPPPPPSLPWWWWLLIVVIVILVLVIILIYVLWGRRRRGGGYPPPEGEAI